jgi:hypothetical protein
MAQHFLLSRAAKTLSLASVFSMKDADAEMTFRRIRWADTDGEPVCPHCGSVDAYDCRRFKGAPPLPLQGLQKGFQHHGGNAVRQPQAAAALLSRGHRDLLQ